MGAVDDKALAKAKAALRKPAKPSQFKSDCLETHRACEDLLHQGGSLMEFNRALRKASNLLKRASR